MSVNFLLKPYYLPKVTFYFYNTFVTLYIIPGELIVLKYFENIYEIRQRRKTVCYIKNGVMYSKSAFPFDNNFNRIVLQQMF